MYIFIGIVYFLLLFQSGYKVVGAKPIDGKPATIEKSIVSVNNNIAKDKSLNPQQKRKLEQAVEKGKIVTSYGVVKVTEEADDKRKKCLV